MTFALRRFWLLNRAALSEKLFVSNGLAQKTALPNVIWGKVTHSRLSSVFMSSNNNNYSLMLFDNGKASDESRSPSYRKLVLAAAFFGLSVKDDKTTDTEDDEKIIHIIKLAKLAFQREDYKKSEQLLHLALKMAHDTQHHEAQRYIIDEMANNAYESGNYLKAEKLFKETMKTLFSEGYGQSDNSIIHISIKLASIYAKIDKDAEADVGFRFCIENLEDKMKSGADNLDAHALYCLTLSSYGEFLYNRAFYTQSLDLFKKSYDTSVKVNGPHHPFSLQQLNSMAACYSLLNRFDEAVACLQSATAIDHEAGLEDAINELPYYHVNLTNVYLTQLENASANRKEILQRASISCQKALELSKKIGNKEALVEAEKCMAVITKHLDELSR
nr:EOG090X06TI [Ilyocryptus agilis]